MEHTDLYRLVFTFGIPGRDPVTLTSTPTSLDVAMRTWANLTKSGAYAHDSGNRVRVLSADACAKAGIR